MQVAQRLRPGDGDRTTGGCQLEEMPHMMRAVVHLMPFAALAGGILVLVKPPLLNYVVAVYLILVGTIGLNHMYHFIR
jgi:hypothetical protein